MSLKKTYFRRYLPSPKGHQEITPEYALKNPNKIAYFPTAFRSHFPTNEQKIRQCSQWKVCSRPREAFSHGGMVVNSFHFLLQRSEFYWQFGLFFNSGNSLVSGVNPWCRYWPMINCGNAFVHTRLVEVYNCAENVAWAKHKNNLKYLVAFIKHMK